MGSGFAAFWGLLGWHLSGGWRQDEYLKENCKFYLQGVLH